MLTSFLAQALVTTHATLATATTDWSMWDKKWLREPAMTEAAKDTDYMFMWLWWFCVIWFVGLMGIMAYFCIVYRRKPGKIAERSASHNLTLELAWTIIPTLFLVWIFFKGFWGYMEKMVPASAGNGMELKLTGYKWSWDLEYPNGLVINRGVSSTSFGAEAVPVFYVPADVPVKLRMNSTDVMHSFWIPDFRVKQDLIPNRYTGMTFTAIGPKDGMPGVLVHPSSKEEETRNRAYVPGSSLGRIAPEYVPELAGVKYTDHWVFCAEYCGTYHSEMAAVIRVVSQEDYDKWMAYMVKRSTPTDPVEWGKLLYKGKCMSCHSVDGSKNTGPTWKNLYGYQHDYTDGKKIVADDNHIVESIRNPGLHVRVGYANNMNAFSEAQMPAKQVEAIIAYMKSLSDRGPKTAPSEGDAPAKEEPKEQASAIK
ncbi:MAG: c-type cytochrome [Phycisphaerae bacterium]|jgi:cytochrome c oxidase subunit 2